MSEGLTEQAQANPVLDYSYLAVIVVALGFAGTAWVYANRKLSNFNKDNAKRKKDVEGQLTQDIYKEATAPLVMTINSYISEQVAPGFNETEREVTERYEESKVNCIDPKMPGFIDISNFADTVEYNQMVGALINSHDEIKKHDESYKNMKNSLSRLMNVTYLPLTLLVASIVLHAVSVLILKDTLVLSVYVQLCFVLGSIGLIPIVVYYFLYMRYVKRLDSSGAEKI